MTRNSQLHQHDILQDPYAQLSKLQKESPFFCSQLGGWVFTRYQDVLEGFKSPFFVAGDIRQQVQNVLGDKSHLVKDYLRVRESMMLHNDGRSHAQARRPFQNSFSRGKISAFEPILNTALEETFRQLSKKSFDFCTDFAEPYSTRVMAALFGIEEEKREGFQRDSDDVSRFFGHSVGDLEADAIKANKGLLSLEQTFNQIIEERKRKPKRDLISFLLNDSRGQKLDRSSLVAQCILILMAGHFTVIDQLSNSFFHFINQRKWVGLKEGRYSLPLALEEGIRYDGGVLFMARVASQDCSFAGVNIKKGETLFLGMGAANRDQSIFERSHELCLDRSPNPHLGFGAGPHQCLGTHLARVEMQLAFEQLLCRFDGFELLESKRKCESLFFRGFYHIKVRAYS